LDRRLHLVLVGDVGADEDTADFLCQGLTAFRVDVRDDDCRSSRRQLPDRCFSQTACAAGYEGGNSVQFHGAHSIKQPTKKLERRSVWWGISHPPTVLLPTSCTRPAREVRDGTDPHRGGFHHQYGCPHRSVAPTLSYSPTRALDRACLPVRSTPGYSVPSRHPSPL